MSYLIKDTSKEERKKIAKEALAISVASDKMPSKEVIELTKEYINGKMELDEVKKRIIEHYRKSWIMDSIYELPNGTLRNKLCITDPDELEQAETDISFTNLMYLQKDLAKECDAELLRKINQYLFGDIYEWAGEYRKFPVSKEEDVLNGDSVRYTLPENIEDELYIVTDDMNNYDWENKNIDEISEKFAYYLAQIWKIHPFREGNTRTVLGFGEIFAKEHGFEMDLSKMINDLERIEDPETGEIIRYGLRDKFVLASLDKEDGPEPEHLEKIVRKSIVSGIEKKIDELEDLLDR